MRMASKPLNLTLDPASQKLIVAFAKAWGCSRSDVVRRLLREKEAEQVRASGAPVLKSRKSS